MYAALVVLAALCLFGLVLVVDGWTANRNDFAKKVDKPRERFEDGLRHRTYGPGGAR